MNRKTEVSLEGTELSDDSSSAVTTEIGIFLDRNWGDNELREQVLLMTPWEFEKLCKLVKWKVEDGIWSIGTAEPGR